LDIKSIFLEEKTMKKRSLFAAVAMLIVSAIVLTSSTYAWFSSGNRAVVSAITGSVSNNAGDIRLSGDGGTTWYDNLDSDAKYSATNLKKASTYHAVDADLSGSAPTFVKGTLASGVWTKDTETGAVEGTDYTFYTFKVKATAAASVTCSPNWTCQANFGYAVVYIDGVQSGIFGSTANDNYGSLPSSVTSANDTNRNDIIDSDDTSAPTLTTVTATNPASIPLTFTSGQVMEFRVYIWAEGQDAQCTGTVNPASIGMGFTFTK
jgi:hypothetical protein